MLQYIVNLSIHHRGVVLALTVAFLLYGIQSARRAELDVFPDFVQPQATIQTEAPGPCRPNRSSRSGTRAVESAVSGVPSIAALRSQSIQGLSIVNVYFDEGTSIFLARQLLSEQLTAVIEELPVGVQAPKLTPLTSATMDLLKIGLVSDVRSTMDLRTFADWDAPAAAPGGTRSGAGRHYGRRGA